MAGAMGKITMRVLTVSLGVPLGMATRKVARAAFDVARPDAKGHNPSDSNARWADVVSWAALSSAAVVSADLMARRTAEEIWKFLLGTQPPGKSGRKVRRRARITA